MKQVFNSISSISLAFLFVEMLQSISWNFELSKVTSRRVCFCSLKTCQQTLFDQFPGHLYLAVRVSPFHLATKNNWIPYRNIDVSANRLFYIVLPICSLYFDDDAVSVLTSSLFASRGRNRRRKIPGGLARVVQWTRFENVAAIWVRCNKTRQ